MRFVCDFDSQAARKSRLYVLLSGEKMVLTQALSALFLSGGTVLWIAVSPRLGAFGVCAGLIITVLLMWRHYDIRTMHGLIRQGSDTVALHEALPPDVLGRLSSTESPHRIWQSLKDSWYVRTFCVRYGIHPDIFEHLSKEKDPELVQQLLSDAYGLSVRKNIGYISPVALLIALLRTYPNIDQILAELQLDERDLEEAVRWLHNERTMLDKRGAKKKYGGLARDWTAGFTPTLNRMSANITQVIEQGGLDHMSIESHAQTMEEMVTNLVKPRGNVVLVGDVGSGKTITVHGFAKRLIQGKKLPERIRYSKVYQLSASAVISSSSDPGHIESSLYALVTEARKSGKSILFFDSAHNLFTEGTGAVDLSRAMLDIIKSGAAPIILEMTPVQWQEVSAKHAELAGMAHILKVNPADDDTTLRILEDHCLSFEARQGVVITHKALKECIALAERYIEGIVAPGRAINLLESSISHAEENGLVTERSVQLTVEAVYGIKVQTASKAESQELLHLEDSIHRRMVNQTRAVKVVSDALRRARSGVGNPNKPIGTFLFLGPTGVGKTELSKALSETYFGDESKIIRVDMNEFAAADDIHRLIDPSISTSLLSTVGRDRFTVVLLDEIEKAHSDVVNALLQMLDEGIMRDADNRGISFKDTIVIATSNAGADKIRSYISEGKDVEEFEQQFVNELIDSGLFRPEFLNRFDETVVFRPLKDEELLQVADLLLRDVNTVLQKKKVTVVLSQEAKSWLVQHGNDPRLGARPLKRMIQRTVENVVAKKLLEGSVQPGHTVMLNVIDLQNELESGGQ